MECKKKKKTKTTMVKISILIYIKYIIVIKNPFGKYWFPNRLFAIYFKELVSGRPNQKRF